MIYKGIQLSQIAQEQIRNIKHYTIENYSENQWKRYKERLIAGLEMLASNPQLGKECSDIYENGYYFPIAKHAVYFTIEPDFILVVAVLSHSQLPQKHLS